MARARRLPHPGHGARRAGEGRGVCRSRGGGTVDHVDEALIGFTFNAPEEPPVTVLERISGPGDSGGPAFLCAELSLDAMGRLACTGERPLVGISAFQFSDDTPFQEGIYGVQERYARVSSHMEWLTGTMRSGASGRCVNGRWAGATPPCLNRPLPRP